MKKRNLGLCLLPVLLVTGCSSSTTGETQESETTETSVYADSVQLLDAVWAAIPEDEQFMIIGGYEDTVVENEAASLDTQSENAAMTFVIPPAVLEESVSAADIQHALLANNFTAIAMEFTNGTDLENLASEIIDNAKTAQWICSIPEMIYVGSYSNYLIYYYGNTQLTDSFETAAADVLNGFKVLEETTVE